MCVCVCGGWVGGCFVCVSSLVCIVGFIFVDVDSVFRFYV